MEPVKEIAQVSCAHEKWSRAMIVIVDVTILGVEDYNLVCVSNMPNRE